MKIDVQAKDLNKLVMMLDWMRANDMVIPDYHHNGIVTNIGDVRFYFTNEKDAVLFALRWL